MNDVGAWDQQFCRLENEEFFALILAANCLGIESLLDATCKTFANELKGKEPEEIRKRWDIPVGFPTKEKEVEVREANEWRVED